MDKIKGNANKAMADRIGVYNGKCKLLDQNRNFMTKKDDVELCMADLNRKKSKGFDRIPVCLFSSKNYEMKADLAFLQHL